MKIAYTTDYDAQDIANWSGLGVFITKFLLNQGANSRLKCITRSKPLTALDL